MSDRIEDAIAAMSRARIRAQDLATYLVRADRVQVGDLLDLEGDPIADPTGDGIGEGGHFYGFEFELCEVEAVEVETPDCIVIHTGVGSFGFPPDHEIEISLERNAGANFYRCGGCDHLHPVGWTGDCRDDAFRFTDSELEDELGQPGTGWEETDEQGRQLV